MDDEKLFTIKDMRNAFIAGERYESAFISYENGDNPDLTEDDFGDWMMDNYNIDVDN